MRVFPGVFPFKKTAPSHIELIVGAAILSCVFCINVFLMPVQFATRENRPRTRRSCRINKHRQLFLICGNFIVIEIFIRDLSRKIIWIEIGLVMVIDLKTFSAAKWWSRGDQHVIFTLSANLNVSWPWTNGRIKLLPKLHLWRPKSLKRQICNDLGEAEIRRKKAAKLIFIA